LRNKFLLLYLHGFLSSPLSKKAQKTIDYGKSIGIFDAIEVPSLPVGPADTIERLHLLIRSREAENLLLIGSSLGGYFATYLSEVFNAPSVLINPAIDPHKHWRKYLGQHRNYHTEEVHEVTEAHVKELEKLHVPRKSYPKNFLVFAQKGDEVLDYRLALEAFGKENCIIREGGNHSYENYELELPHIFDFLLSRIN